MNSLDVSMLSSTLQQNGAMDSLDLQTPLQARPLLQGRRITCRGRHCSPSWTVALLSTMVAVGAVGYSIYASHGAQLDCASSPPSSPPPSTSQAPHIVMILIDDWGWANAGWHRNTLGPGGHFIPATSEVRTPHMDALVREGIELDRHYVWAVCAPSRSALQSGRNPIHVNLMNINPYNSNPLDPVSGFSGIPRNMSGIATKLAAAGYSTHAYGKWDVGMATVDHTPAGRGYQAGLTYFHHQNDYWTMVTGWWEVPAGSSRWSVGCPTGRGNATQPIVDLWQTRTVGDVTSGTAALGLNSSCVHLVPDGGQPATCAVGPKNDAGYGGYEDALFEERVLQAIDAHDPSSPLFLFWAPHLVHVPLQVPAAYFEAFSSMAPTDRPSHARQRYHAMVTMADSMVGNVTSRLRARGMWESTLLVLSTDNGGPIHEMGEVQRDAHAHVHPMPA